VSVSRFRRSRRRIEERVRRGSGLGAREPDGVRADNAAVRTEQLVREAGGIHADCESRGAAVRESEVAKEGLPYPEVPDAVRTIPGVDEKKRSLLRNPLNDEPAAGLERPPLEQQDLDKTGGAADTAPVVAWGRDVQRGRPMAVPSDTLAQFGRIADDRRAAPVEAIARGHCPRLRERVIRYNRTARLRHCVLSAKRRRGDCRTNGYSKSGGADA
jgi:hypothetical protein